MAVENDDFAWLEDMVIAGETVMRHAAGKSRTDLDSNEMFRDAIERKLEIFGEAARRLSAGLTDSHTQIPWHKIMATRHILAHDYDEIDYDIIWRIVTVHIPETVREIRKILPPPGAEPTKESGAI